MGKLLYLGHGSYRITTSNQTVIYVDPYAGSNYREKGDIVLITHEHYDHNRIELVTFKNDQGIIIRSKDLHPEENVYESRIVKDVKITATKAENANHNPLDCVGYILEFDGIKLYAAGDTSYFEEMKMMSKMHIDYALLPTDGKYNMGPIEASKVAQIINPKVAIPIHTRPGVLFDPNVAAQFQYKGKKVILPNEEIELKI